MNPFRTRLARFLPVAVAAAIGAGVGVGVYAATSSSGSPQTATTPALAVPAQPASTQTSSGDLTQLYKQDAPGVVDITVTSTTTSSGGSGGINPFNPFGNPSQPPQQQTQQAEGTGFVIDTKGDIVTAQHVVSGAGSISVQFQNGTNAKASLVGTDKSTDTAVIHVDVPAAELHPLTLGNSSAVQPGQEVVAIGSPFGYTESMTQGIVSATGRDITAPNDFSIPNAIQTDAAINHGNSGGPLIDVATNSVIGVNDQIESNSNDNAGVGFAVPINAAKSSADTLISGGTIRHAYLGVFIETAANGGARVTKVKSGTPAATAGLKSGDVIVAAGGKSIANADALTGVVTAGHPGQKLDLTVRRGSSTRQVTVTLGTQPS